MHGANHHTNAYISIFVLFSTPSFVTRTNHLTADPKGGGDVEAGLNGDGGDGGVDENISMLFLGFD